jgi:hypothetical protein
MADLQRCEPAPGAGIACYSGSVVTHVAIVSKLTASCAPLSAIPALT